MILTLGLLLATALVFAIWPQLDPAIARLFYRGPRFYAENPALRALRKVLYYGPIAIFLPAILIWLTARLGFRVRAQYVPHGRTVVFLLVSLLLTPGLIVNVILKEHSGRPRPSQVADFGGKAQFRPWYSFDGACKSNCSFVSGEAATAAALVAPASLVPAPWRAPAIAGAIIVAVATGLLRMAFGGHFASDILFAILLTILSVQLLYRVLIGSRRSG